MASEIKARIEGESEVKAYIQNLKYALKNGAKIEFQAKRRVDDNRDEKYTNQYTVNTLFPDENPVDALKRELLTLRVELLGAYGSPTTFIMSFHFAVKAFTPEMFPYRKN